MQTELEVEVEEHAESSQLDMRLLQAQLVTRTGPPASLAMASAARSKGLQPSAACAANSECNKLGLEGNCCPNDGGVALGCCDSAILGTSEAAGGAQPVPPAVNSTAACSANKDCAEMELEGNCCPNDGGVSLGCCTPGLAAASLPPLAPPAATPGPLMTFYMYRVQNEENYAMNGVNMANLDGDVWYLHNEVVQHCPRKFNISRLLRFKVTMRATPELFGQGKNFDTFVAFDKAKCTVPMCPKLHWDRFGYVVGCQPNNKEQVAVPGEPTWFSLPGTCPSQFFDEKSQSCIEAEPGGECNNGEVTGTRTCTYHMEKAGEIRLDELSGIANYNEICEATGLKEYDIFQDKGNGTSFWDGKLDAAKGKARLQHVYDLFGRKYPELPAYLQDPKCDV